MDKNKVMIEFLQTCPSIQNDAIFFNFGNVEDGAHQMLTKSDSTDTVTRKFVDGTAQKRFTFYLDNFTSVSYNPIVTTNTDENLTEFIAIQDIIDWITEQNELGNYPDFGTDCVVENMESMTQKPEMIGVDSTINSPIAIYRISIRIDYIDYSQRLWN